MERLVRLTRDGHLSLVVVGLGYVGLPTATLFADAGFNVVGVDIKPEIVNAVNRGVSPINEPGLNELVLRNVRAGRLRAAAELGEALREAGAVLVSVQTPVDEGRRPDLSFLERALRDVGVGLRRGVLVVVCSTVPPGTMLGFVKPLLESLSGLRVEDDFFLAYAPERIAPGRALKEFVENPRLVGGVGPKSTRLVAELFRAVCREVIETNAPVAEVAKLAENAFRDVNIAFANLLALICEQYGVDVWEVIRLANTHPRVSIHTPGAGVGGPCLTKDPYLLIHKFEFKHNLIKVAREVNDYMPEHVVKLVTQALKKVGKEVRGSKVAVLGTAYKADVDDPRESPAKPIIEGLIKLGARVAAYDPYCKESFGAERAETLREALRRADCVVVVTGHTVFKKLDLQELKELMGDNPIIVDGRRVVNAGKAEKLGFTYYGIGLGRKENRRLEYLRS